MAATDEKAIHEFPTGTIDDNSLLIMDRPTATPGEYETEKFAIANLGLKLLGGIDFPNNLDTDEQDIFGAINEVNAKAMNIAAEYDETESYSKGNYCIYQNSTYRCVKASGTTTGPFVAADWTQILVLGEVKSNADAIAQNTIDIATKQNILTSSQRDGTYSSAITINPNDKELKIRTYGKMVVIEGFFQAKADISANTLISSTGLSFLGQAQFVGFGGSGNSPIPFNISQSGNITVLAGISNNSWVNFCVTNMLA